jgi:S-formylglutathione hydrolase FrmB
MIQRDTSPEAAPLVAVVPRRRRNGRRPARTLVALALPVAVLAPVQAVQAAPAAPDRARVVAREKVGDRLLELTVDSPALGRDARVRLLTPDGWERRTPGKRWPTLYLFAGGDGDLESWVKDHRIDRLPELRDVLVVMPEMPLYGFYSDWWNHGAGGTPKVETFHLDEVRPLLERDYGAGTRRAAGGESQGGFGAFSYGARHPGMFRSLASYSGYIHPHQHPWTVKAGMDYLGLDWLALWGHPVRQARIWKAHDPYYMAERLRSTPSYIASGDGRAGALDPPDVEPDPDIPGLEDPDAPFPEDVISPTEAIMEEEGRAFADRLKAVGAPVRTHFYSGTHSPPYWGREFRNSLPMLLKSLGR